MLHCYTSARDWDELKSNLRNDSSQPHATHSRPEQTGIGVRRASFPRSIREYEFDFTNVRAQRAIVMVILAVNIGGQAAPQ
jgi:hypothetical protein